MPEELRATGGNYKTLPELTKALREAKQALSGKVEGMVKVPGENATEAEKLAFAKALGVPASATDYKIAKPDGELGNFFNEKEANEFAIEAHKLGLTPAQANGLLAWRLNVAKSMDDAERADGQKYLAEREDTLKKAWGNHYDQEMVNAQRMLATMDHTLGKEDLQFLPAKLVIALASMTHKLSPDTLVTQAAVHNRMSPRDVSNDIISNKNNPDHEAYHNSTHPNHQAVVAKVLEGFK